ncbi:MAG TPA: VOC family protein [Acidimicrobiales bacterium]|nr:VOC family protein [Acidimicrobiales bacterium]
MTVVSRASFGHVALTVTDLDASIEWYSRIFDVHYVMEEAHQGGIGKLLADDQFGLVFVLHHHDGNEGETFAETTTGLDHVGLNVGSRADLEAWQSHLEANGVARADNADKPLTQSPITDRPYGSVLVFRDPDNIQLELFAPARP